jgi:hypothetical protein
MWVPPQVGIVAKGSGGALFGIACGNVSFAVGLQWVSLFSTFVWR